MKVMKTVVDFLAVPAILLAVLMVVAGKSAVHSVAYVRAVAWQAYDSITRLFPSEVRDKVLERELRQARSDVVDWRVKLIRSARQIEQLRAERDKLSDRVQRDNQVLTETYPVLKAAIHDRQPSVRFAGAVMPLSDFQREIDDLLSRHSLDTETLALEDEGLARLESQQEQAEDTLTASELALESAEHEIAILKARSDHATIVARTTELVATISVNLKAPHSAIADGISDLRAEVLDSEARNEAVRVMASTDMQPPVGSLSRDRARLGALETIHDEVQAQKRAKGLTELGNAVPTAKDAGMAAFGCDR